MKTSFAAASPDKVLGDLLSRVVRGGYLDVTTPGGTTRRLGNGAGPHLAIRFTDAAAVWGLLLDPELAFGELYTDGRILLDRGTIYDLLAMVMRGAPGNRSLLRFHPLGLARDLAWRLQSGNTPVLARRNVAHHYDLDGRLYALFLDADRQYSCAYFERPDQSLDEAQAAKKRHIAAKLRLVPGNRVLDIGSGWGGLALTLAKLVPEIDVTGVTLSTEQHGYSQARAAREALAERVHFALKDYRAVEGCFDRIVSVGMFEHVGLANYPDFFATAARLLHDSGTMLLHTIGLSGPACRTNPWITKYIFPGGHIPSLSEIVPVIERTGLIVTDVEVLRLHYALTLRHWRERFLSRWAEAARLYDERFCRMWEFYLACCEAAFRFEDLVVFQIQIARRNDVVPITRGYIEAAETQLRDRS